MEPSPRDPEVEDPNESAEDRQVRHQAAKDLDWVTTLINSHAYQNYWIPRLNQKISGVEALIIEGNGTESDIAKLREVRAALKEIQRMPHEDQAGMRSILGLN